MTIELFNPALAPAVPILQCLETDGRVIEVSASDFRTDTTQPVYLMVFIGEEAPEDGDAPSWPALKICTFAQQDWPNNDSPFLVQGGFWAAISQTALTYTAMPESQDFAMGARVLP